jgi:hypothetical protein
MSLLNISSSIQQVDPNVIFTDGFELSNQSVIPSELYSGSFTPGLNNIEFYIYSQGIVQYSDYNFSDYQITSNSNPNQGPQGSAPNQTFVQGDTTNVIDLSPEKDVYSSGFTQGNLTAIYNFVNLELSSSIDNPYYLSEISSDRTEIRLKSNYLNNDQIQSTFITFEQQLREAEFFDEFYISFGSNEYHIGVNTKLDIPEEEIVDGTPTQYSILIKLYDALPAKYVVGNELYVLTKTGETQAFEIEFDDIVTIPDDTIKLQGPNINIKIKDFINNSTTYQSENELLSTQSSGSKDQLLNTLEQKGIKLTPNYSTASFNEYVNFSSAKSRVNNFITKVENIQAYEADIATINAITGSNPNVIPISESIASLYTKIENEIKGFDGFEYYQYYSTSSDAYPKTGSDYPQELLLTTDVKVKTWLGSDNDLNQYYGGTLLSASLYDEDNPNWLYYTIPTFITEQSDNDNYVDFCNMVGQSFDELWLYTKAITEKLNTTNQLDKGVPLSLADDVITSLGYTGFGNNYNNQDNFIGLIGNNDGDFLPSTGSELITQYIAVNSGSITNYWHPEYSFEGYVEQLTNNGFPYPIDRVSKEIYKRLYHNMAYLVKKKGTIAGLRQLITIWGIPSTILRINEFGGKNKDQTDDYDLWYRRYNYAFTPVATSNQASASAVVPWMPLNRNFIAESEYIVPDGVGVRFKTFGYPSSSFGAGNYATQSIIAKKSNGTDDSAMDWAVVLNYTGSASGSYSGSSFSGYRNWGELTLHVSGNAADGGNAISDPIYLPFFDKGWWTILVQRDTHTTASNNSTGTTYTLYAKNKIYDGNDGNSIGFEGSASINSFDTGGAGVYGTGLYGTGLYGGYNSSSINYAWNKFGTTKLDGIYIGGRLTGSDVGGYITNTDGRGFSGSFQEFRYYSNDISESVFNDFVMNPESIEGNNITGSESSFDIVNFRAPLGNELENIFTASATAVYEEYITSSHPAITGSYPSIITASFVNPNDSNTLTSSYYVQYQDNTVKRTYSKINRETYFLDQPSIGIRNRISNKIQATSNLNFGTALSQYVSIQKDPFISQSYTENINTLEVAFSPQDEINDDIIQSLGYGAVQEAIADPRFRSSSDDYYPQLKEISEDYFKKYKGSDVFAYMRLIKYFDDSLFKAIKNYVPARTSVSTGIVIKQNMLERNRYREPQVDIVTTQSYAIQNIPLTSKNLELTGSIELNSASGSTGGSLNKYNVTSSQFGYYSLETTANSLVAAGSYRLVNQLTGTAIAAPGQNPVELYGNLYADQSNDTFKVTPSADPPAAGYLRSTNPVLAQLALQISASIITDVALIVSSSIRGEIFKTDPFTPNGTLQSFISPQLDILPEEALAFYVHNVGNNISSVIFKYAAMKTYDSLDPNLNVGSGPMDISSSGDFSKQGYIQYNPTPVGIIGEPEVTQKEFYDGEVSGSAIDTYVTQSNPWLKPGKRINGVFNVTMTGSAQREILSSSFQIPGTQSIIFENSNFNALSGNATSSVTSSHRYLLSYNDEQYCPENSSSIIDIMYASPYYSGSATKATIPDSFYTENASVNARYDGTKIKSLNYNSFTPSGTVGPITELPIAPYNQATRQVIFPTAVAPKFLDGTTGSWSGDVSFGNTAVITKNPIFIAHFNRSFEQLALYNSREFVIDSLIEIPTGDMKGANAEIILNNENSINIDGSNLNKKSVSSVFEPDRKVAISYTTLDPQNQDSLSLESLSAGLNTLQGGGVEFLVINSNSKNRTVIGERYNYILGDATLAQIVFKGNLTGSVFANTADSLGTGIVTSGSYFQQGTIGISATVDGNQVPFTGGLIWPIVDGNGRITEVVFSASGENYTPGDVITITTSSMAVYGYTPSVPAGSDPVALRIVIPKDNIQNQATRNVYQSPNAIQMVTSSNIINGEETFGFLLSGSNTTGSDGTFLVPFAQDFDKSGASTLPDVNRCSIGGPQLALFHGYNYLVKNGVTSQTIPLASDPSSFCSTTSQSRVFIKDGLDPADPANYWEWQPSSSDTPFYEDVNEPFLINRGDVLRVEGIKVIPSSGEQSQSVAFVEDFTVQEIQDYSYTGSDFNPTGGSTVISSSINTVNPFSVPTEKFPSNYNVAGMPDTKIFKQSSGDFNYNGSAGTGLEILITSFTADSRGVGSTTILTYNSFVVANSTNAQTQGAYVAGETITITAAQIQAKFGNSTNSNNVILTLQSNNLAPENGYPNDFTLETMYNVPSCAPEYVAYGIKTIGQMALSLKSFINVTPNPAVVLNGLDGGAITKFTIRRQLENEQKIVVKDITPPSGSQGALSQTRGGFLLPNDISEKQKNNALNIINELRAKNAFPGDTASSTTATDSNTSSS